MFITNGLEHFASKRQIQAFKCDAIAYSVEHQSNISQAIGNIHLKAVEHNGSLSLSYYSAFENDVREYAVFSGNNTDLDVGALTYHFDMTTKEFKFVEMSPFAQYLSQELNIERFEVDQVFEQDIQILDMDLARHFLVIKFMPSNHIWACDILGGQ
ncbi:hypothetical protein [Shewanella aestuarii]|uniref:Uncharacterized protein n=1 Tax=Shewanella aestuarii TaxID=1028752 RepID=A0A6G9QLV5_9GAMM|nr:hypothetical protein [Shewanella aestuarii]QIR15526.1 hypothetical protein HBH39_14385 [Shewanella aestuarii]